MLLDKVPFVLALQVGAPEYRILELYAVFCGLLEDADAFRVFETHELGVDDAAQALDELGVVAVVEELDVVEAVVKGVAHKVLDEVLGEVHIVLKVVEGHFRLDHPEFR